MTTTYELYAPPTDEEDDQPTGIMATTTSARVAKNWAKDNGPQTVKTAG